MSWGIGSSVTRTARSKPYSGANTSLTLTGLGAGTSKSAHSSRMNDRA